MKIIKSFNIGVLIFIVILVLLSGVALSTNHISIGKNQNSSFPGILPDQVSEKKMANNEVHITGSRAVVFHKNNPLGAGSTITTITVGNYPVGIAYGNFTKQMFVANSLSADVSVIDSSTNTVSYNMSLPPYLFQIAYDPVNGYLYAPDESLNKIWVFSPSGSTYSETGFINLPAGGGGIAYDPSNQEMYITIPSLNEVVVLAPNSASIVNTISSLPLDPQYLAYDPSNGIMYVTSDSANAITGITGTNSLVSVTGTFSYPKGIVYDPSNKDLYVANYESKSVTVIDTNTEQEIANITITGQKVYGIAYDPVNSYIYVTDYYDTVTSLVGTTVSIINSTTNDYVGSITVGLEPQGIAYDPANGDMYVTNTVSDTVSVISSPSVSISPSPSSIDIGQTATITAAPLAGSGTYSSYSWYSEPPGSSTFLVVSGVTTSSYSFSPSTNAALGAYHFEATVTDSNGATSLFSSEVSVTVSADPTVSISPSGPLTYSVGQSASQLTATVTYSGSNTASVEWYSNSADSNTGGTDTGVSGTSFTPSTSTSGSVYYYASVTDSAVSGYSYQSNVVELTINANHHHQALVKYFGYFFENGLPPGTTWSVTVDGTLYKNNTQFIYLILPSGLNNFTVGNVPGYSVANTSPPGPEFKVSSAPFEVLVTFSPINSGGNSATGSSNTNGFLTGSLSSNSTLYINGVQYIVKQGEFNITLTPGNYTIEVKQLGQPTYFKDITIKASSPTPLNVIRDKSYPLVTLSAIQALFTLLILSLVSLASASILLMIKLRRFRKMMK